jgi:Fe-S cluster biogenesis protein NfuA
MSTEIESMIERFRHMVARDGGELTVVSASPEAVRLRYRAADAAPDCADGTCVLPHRELEQLMGETFARNWPGMRVEVEAAR